MRRNHLPQRLDANPRPAGNNEIAGIEKCCVTPPNRNLHKGVRSQNEINLIPRILLAKSPHCMNGIENPGHTVLIGPFRERRNESCLAHASQRHHCVTVRKRRQFLRFLVRRPRRRNEMNFIQPKPSRRRCRYNQMSAVNWIKRAAKNSSGAPVLGNALQRSSGRVAAPSLVGSDTCGASSSRLPSGPSCCPRS